jgi:hypothetical protein
LSEGGVMLKEIRHAGKLLGWEVMTNYYFENEEEVKDAISKYINTKVNVEIIYDNLVESGKSIKEVCGRINENTITYFCDTFYTEEYRQFLIEFLVKRFELKEK